jgi:HAD superfamily hydrolase (TIGR01509 family)
MSGTNGIGKLEWIFFDLDGTLADSITALFDVYRKFLSELSIPADETDLPRLNGFSLLEIVSFLKSKYKIGQTETDLYDLYKLRIAQAYAQQVFPMEGADRTLHMLSKLFKLQLVTSGSKPEAMAFLAKQGWDTLFSGFVFGDEVVRGKPDPGIFQLALSRAGCSSNAAVTVEDSVNGVKSSTGAGLSTIGFSNRTRSKDLIDAGASATVKNLDELIPILQSRAASHR